MMRIVQYGNFDSGGANVNAERKGLKIHDLPPFYQLADLRRVF